MRIFLFASFVVAQLAWAGAKKDTQSKELPQVLVAHAAHCAAEMLLQHPSLRPLLANTAYEAIAPGFEGFPEEQRIRTWFTQPVWRPEEYRVYGIRDWDAAQAWTNQWGKNVDVLAAYLGGKITAQEANPVAQAWSKVPFQDSPVREVQNAYSTGGFRAGLVMGTATQLPPDALAAVFLPAPQGSDSLTFFVPARDRRQTALWSLVIVATRRTPVAP